jgi:GTPase
VTADTFSFDDTEGSGSGRAVVVHPVLPDASSLHRPEPALDEACGLALAIRLEVVGRRLVTVRRPRPATLIGGGVVEEIADLVRDLEVTVVIVDAALTPVQQRNLERAWNTKVIDRTGLILEIFGERARTREGRLQVELAALTYQRTRLVRSWTHLERQRGGRGFLGGPGESQLEIDRRIIDEEIARLKRELEDVKRTRGLHREARRRVPYPVVALVGYTNAGKSTLFNRLTRADVVARDRLFATLDPTMRAVKLPSGRRIVLSDTVGFISGLPTQLVAAFRATLEEVLEADVILHVRDIAHPETGAQKRDVEDVLGDLGVFAEGERCVIELDNKIDLLDAEAVATLERQVARQSRVVAASAVTGVGIEDLLALLDREIAAMRAVVAITVPHTDGAAVAWLHEHGQVLERAEGAETVTLVVALEPEDATRFELRFGHPVSSIPETGSRPAAASGPSLS